MTLSHSQQIENKPSDPLNTLYDFLDNNHDIPQKYESFEKAEQAIKSMVNALERSILNEALSQYDIDVPIIELDGKIYHRVLRNKEKTYMSAAGTIQVERTLYRADGHCICPLELQAGIVEGFWTPSAARLGYYVTAQISPYQGEELFKEFAQMQPSKSALTRLSTQLGEFWDNEHECFENMLCGEIKIPDEAVTVSGSLDGIMLPLNKKTENGYEPPVLPENPTQQEQQEYQDKKTKAFYREASCAAISFYDEDGERLKSIRLGSMPEEGKKTLKRMLTKSIEHIVSEQPDINIVKIADGATDNWRYFSDALLPKQGTEILDYFHASDHLNDAFKSAFGEDSNKANSQYKLYKTILKTEVGGVEKVINALRYLSKKHPSNKTLKTQLNYFRNNRKRMKYAQAIELNYPIGSGVTEATCKTLVTQRMKCAGMRWDIKGGQGVLNARSLIQSELFDKGWQFLAEKHIKEITLPENVIAFRKK